MVITALVSRVEVEVFRIDDRADFNRFGIDLKFRSFEAVEHRIAESPNE